VGPEVTITNRHPRLRGAASARRALRVLLAHRSDFELADSVFRPDTLALSLTFLSDRELAQLHGQFLDDPTETDVITFPAQPGFGFAGEICVSVDAARRQPGRVFSDELALYVVHGWLHLAGHDDLAPAKKRRMRRAEQRALALLRNAGAMPRFALAGKAR
jgi:probable rRNA maturation factor